ncbi:MAG: aspartate 1-decarboxylase [Firmicutes bacterium]|nr:aspartate 1-decarboxylase [Bacillota bacterium]
MLVTMLKSKIHRATVTETDLNYVGSITIDEELLDLANILPNEKVEVFNLNTGARFETYAIPGARGTGVIGLNGAAARLALPGDKVIILAYGLVDQEEAKNLKPAIIILHDDNRYIP